MNNERGEMGSAEIIVMSIFGLLVLAGLAAGIHQGAKQRRQAAAYSSHRGYALLKRNEPRLASLLGLISPNMSWSPDTVMLVEPPPHAIYLFGALVNTRGGNTRASTGWACLAEYDTGFLAHPVAIFTRIPGADFLVNGRVDAGSEEFRREFSITGSDPASAQLAIDPGIERILLDHATAPGWNLNVYLSSKGIIIESRWALTDDEWDYLVALARKLRAAL